MENGSLPDSLAQEFFKCALDLLCIGGTDGYFKHVNPRWSQLMGYSTEELLSIPYIDLVHPDDLEITIRESKKLITSGDTTTNFQNRYRKKNGDYVWLIWTAFLRGDNFFGAARDISDLKLKETHLNNIQSAAKIGGWSLKIPSLEVTWTTETYKLHEVPDGTPVNKIRAIEFYAEHDRPRITKYVEECISQKIPYDDFFEFTSAKGKKLWIRTNGFPIVDSGGKVVELVGTFQDVTSIRKASIELEEKTKWIEGIIQNSPGMVFQFRMDENLNKHFSFISRQVNEIYGFTVQDVEANQNLLFDAVHPDDVSDLFEAIQESANDLSLFEWQGRIIPSVGIEKTISVRSLPQRIHDGMIQWDGVINDISERVRLEKQLDEEKKKLLHATKLASIGELAAGVGHEINNPLAIAIGNLERIRRKADLGLSIDLNSLNLIENSLQRISRIVGGLRTYARIDETNDRLIEVNEVVLKTLLLISEIYLREGIQIETKFAHQPTFIKGNEGQLQQIIMNLVTNARDALEDKPDRRISISTNVVGKVLKVSISDNGKGISEKDKEKVFDSFFTTKPIGKGTGMGLGISRGLITNMKGEITFESTLGEGTSFVLTLPLTDEIEEESFDFPRKIRNQIKGRVLVVDDEIGIREILKESLEDFGLKVWEAKDGEEGLELIRENKFDFIITDMKMPGMDGVEFIERAQTFSAKGCRFFILTGGVHSQRGLEGLVRRGIVDGVIEKPFSSETIYQFLSQNPLVNKRDW